MQSKYIWYFTITAALAGILSFQNSYFDVSRSMDVFSGVYREVNMYYVDEVDPGKLMKSYLESMLKTLDPYTNYFSESVVESSRLENTGKFGGIGAEIDTLNGELFFAYIDKNKPADKAGIKPGDKLIAIDGSSAKNRSIEDVNRIVRGQPNTTLQLRISDSDGNEKTIILKREEMTETAVPYYGMVDSGTAYIALKSFTETSGADVKKALLDLKKNNPALKGLILDVRNNPGGLLQEAVKISNLFVPKGQIVASTKGKTEEWNKIFAAPEEPVDLQLPVVVLTNNHSASASEIVSGCLQDLDRGVVAGQKTYGKGLVQITKNLPYNTVLKVTTARYFIPSGRCIQAINYAERNPDGSVKKVPDSLKVAFKTKGGRTVFDGGGVDPELLLPEEKPSPLLAALSGQKMLFRFAGKYIKNNPSAPVSGKVSLNESDWNSFKAFCKENKFSFSFETEKGLSELDTVLLNEKYIQSVSPGLKLLRQNIDRWKEECWQNERETILRKLEEEIAGRYFYAEGKIRQSLLTDPWVSEAAGLLANPKKYNELLSASTKPVVGK